MTGTVKALDPLALEAARKARDKAWPLDSLEPSIRAYLSALTASASEPATTEWKADWERIAFNLCSEFGSDFVADKQPFAKAVVREYLASLRPVDAPAPTSDDTLGAVSAAIWNQFLFEVDGLAYGQKFVTPDLKTAEHIARIALAASPDPASEPEPVAWRYFLPNAQTWCISDCKEEIDALLAEFPDYQVHPLYANPVPTPDGAVEPLREAIAVLDGFNDDEISVELLPRLRAALETPWQKPGRAAQAQAGEKPDFPADEQSGETRHGVDYWLHYDHQTGKWCVDRQPPKVIRMGAEVIHVREVAALSHPADGWRDIESAPKDGTNFQAWVVSDESQGSWQYRCRFNPDTEAFEIWGRVDYDIEGWDTYLGLTPTHWMPPATAPLAAKPEGE